MSALRRTIVHGSTAASIAPTALHAMWPSHGLAVLDQLGLDRYRYYHSTRADLLRRNGRDTEARQAYQRALELTQTEPERRYLQDRLAELTPPTRRTIATSMPPFRGRHTCA